MLQFKMILDPTQTLNIEGPNLDPDNPKPSRLQAPAPSVPNTDSETRGRLYQSKPAVMAPTWSFVIQG